jgi:hypothetical protein
LVYQKINLDTENSACALSATVIPCEFYSVHENIVRCDAETFTALIGGISHIFSHDSIFEKGRSSLIRFLSIVLIEFDVGSFLQLNIALEIDKYLKSEINSKAVRS